MRWLLVAAAQDLAGLWVEPRGRFGKLAERYYDVVPDPHGGFKAFPLTACREEKTARRAWQLGAPRMPCANVLDLSAANASAAVGDDGAAEQVATVTSRSKYLGEVTAHVPALERPQELAWSDARRWESPQAMIDYFDQDCAPSGPGVVPDPVEYSVSFGASLNMGFKHILPGLSIDNFNCIEAEWLERHEERFLCILRLAHAELEWAQSQAEEEQQEQKDARTAAFERAISAVRRALPRKSEGHCIPSVCLSVSLLPLPVLVPLPAIGVFLTWPADLRSCNGVELRAELDAAAVGGPEEAEAVAQKVEEFSVLSLEHGVSFDLFPWPGVEYFVNGDADLTAGLQKLAHRFRGSCEATAPADVAGLVVDALGTCPEVRERFLLRGGSNELLHQCMFPEDAGSRERAQREVLAVVRQFPELLSTGRTSSGGVVGVSVGAWASVGATGFSAGVYGSASFKAASLVTKYRGCAAWRRVLEAAAGEEQAQLQRQLCPAAERTVRRAAPDS